MVSGHAPVRGCRRYERVGIGETGTESLEVYLNVPEWVEEVPLLEGALVMRLSLLRVMKVWMNERARRRS